MMPAIQGTSGGERLKYKPWPEEIMYSPGEGEAPELRPNVKYGEAPDVGDLPRIGKRAGDPRCQDRIGFTPCHNCIFEQASTQHYEGDVMPGLESADSAGKNPYTGMSFQLPHPFKGPTPDMNTGRGCDVYGKPYKEPLRYCYLNIHRFNQEADDYETTKSYEVDFGPSMESDEFQEGLRRWKESSDFEIYSQKQRESNPEWQWQDPEEDNPWERCHRVAPNPWLTDDFAPQDPVDQHVQKIQAWAGQSHQAWQDSDKVAAIEGGSPPAAIQDRSLLVS
jgi:hypothetical protein